jgi:hypothetical protein
LLNFKEASLPVIFKGLIEVSQSFLNDLLQENDRILVGLDYFGDVLIARPQVALAQAVDVPGGEAELVRRLRGHHHRKFGTRRLLKKKKFLDGSYSKNNYENIKT